MFFYIIEVRTFVAANTTFAVCYIIVRTAVTTALCTDTVFIWPVVLTSWINNLSVCKSASVYTAVNRFTVNYNGKVTLFGILSCNPTEGINTVFGEQYCQDSVFAVFNSCCSFFRIYPVNKMLNDNGISVPTVTVAVDHFNCNDCTFWTAAITLVVCDTFMSTFKTADALTDDIHAMLVCINFDFRIGFAVKGCFHVRNRCKFTFCVISYKETITFSKPVCFYNITIVLINKFVCTAYSKQSTLIYCYFIAYSFMFSRSADNIQCTAVEFNRWGDYFVRIIWSSYRAIIDYKITAVYSISASANSFKNHIAAVYCNGAVAVTTVIKAGSLECGIITSFKNKMFFVKSYPACNLVRSFKCYIYHCVITGNYI